ncbi:MAG: 3-methyl-2-oxobutanoate hydroxymethyltransferase [Actinomycetota bacterium]|nr:3-methyl-2-oxobutanoate hydroxymethyltransferase [Actinomycetota bacterium]
MPAATPREIAQSKGAGGSPLVMVTAYDAPFAGIAGEAGIDMVLVGDTVGMVVLGMSDTLGVGMREMEHHTRAVARGKPGVLIVADMPWLSYEIDAAEAVRNAGRLLKAGAGAVKVEGCRPDLVSTLVGTGIPVMGHLGLTPQSVHTMGGYRVQGSDVDSASELVDSARVLAEAGCFALVLEGVPSDVGDLVTRSCPVPVIGIGAGPACDGQVLVLHDLLGMGDADPSAPRPRFVRRYADVGALAVRALRQYADDVRNGEFPGPSESYSARGPLADWVKARLGVTATGHDVDDASAVGAD